MLPVSAGSPDPNIAATVAGAQEGTGGTLFFCPVLRGRTTCTEDLQQQIPSESQ